MPKSERDEIMTALTSRIFAAMLDDVVMDAALQSHHEISRSRAVCTVCSTRCGSVHVPNTQATASTSRPVTPLSVEAKPVNGNTGTGTNTPTSVKADGNLYLDCVNCSRQIASNRYAPHLSSCMGLGSARRGAVRGNVKSKLPSDSRKSPSPTSDAEIPPEEVPILKGKAKSKIKRVDEAEFNLKRKRPVSPQVSPHKKQKKQKASGSPVSRVKAGPDVSGIPNSAHYSPSTGSKLKVPSKLRDSSTTSIIERSMTPTSSRSSSPGIGTPTSSSYSARSPSLTSKPPVNTRNIKSKATGHGPPRRASPPRPAVIVQDYTIDVDGGDETGSSTDTDSS